MRVLICGSRHWTNKTVILESLQALSGITLVIDGAAPGADRLGHECAVELGLPTLRFPADWGRHGRAAGMLRNARMLSGGRPDLVLAFHESSTLGRGTRDMVRRAQAAGVPTFIHGEQT